MAGTRGERDKVGKGQGGKRDMWRQGYGETGIKGDRD